MNKTALCLACISSVLLFSTAPAHATGKKIVFNTEKIKYESGTGAERCRDKCGRRSGPDVKSLLAQGWKIASSSSKDVIGEQYWYAPCNTCKPHGCICTGTEYVLEKNEPAPQIEARTDVPDATDKYNPTVIAPQRVETSNNELDILKKENDLLKRENALLKQENETLRNLLRSKQK